MIKGRLYSGLIIILLLCSFSAACSPAKTDRSVTIASKQFTENILLSEMYAQLIEAHTDLKVIRRQNMGSSVVCFAAMEKGEIDIYIEYTGTIYNELLGHEYNPDTAAGELYDLVKKEMNDKKKITVYQTIGLNNTYALAMLRARANALNVKTISDLGKVAPRLVFAANELYYLRAKDGYDTIAEKYDLLFKSAVKMNNSLLYNAVMDGQVDVIVVYATDSLLPKHDMIILEDDKQVFPDYYALPIVRNEVLVKYPELNSVLELLTNSIDNESMQELNYLVDMENKKPKDVANTFLKTLGLL